MTPTHLPLDVLIPAALLVTLGYVAACAIWPFGACRWCRGTGKFRSPSGRAWRYCRRCRGTGARVRTGRRAWTHLTRLHRNSTR